WRKGGEVCIEPHQKNGTERALTNGTVQSQYDNGLTRGELEIEGCLPLHGRPRAVCVGAISSLLTSVLDPRLDGWCIDIGVEIGDITRIVGRQCSGSVQFGEQPSVARHIEHYTARCSVETDCCAPNQHTPDLRRVGLNPQPSDLARRARY